MPRKPTFWIRMRLAAWAVSVVASLVMLAVLTVALVRMQTDFTLVETSGSLPWAYWIAFGGLWLCLTAMAVLLATTPAAAIRLKWKTSVVIIMGVAAAVRIVLAVATTPALSDDIWRYLHDGRTTLHGDNPYARPPSAATPYDADHATILLRVNHPGLVTIYQPTSQAFFALAAGVHGLVGGSWDPLGVRTWRLLISGIDLLVIGLLLWQLRQMDKSAWWAALYAWHPLAVSEVAHAGHQEPIGIALVLVTLMLAGQRPLERNRAILAGLTLAAAVAVKPIVLPMALPLAWFHRKSWRPMMTAAGTTVAALAVLYVPLALTDAGLGGMFDTVRQFTGHWAFNASLAPMLLMAGVPHEAIRPVLAIGLVVVLLAITLILDDPWRASLAYFVAALLFTTTVHPWYLLWPLAILPVRFLPSVWWWSLTISGAYIVLRDLREYELPALVALVEYAGVYLLLAIGLVRKLIRM